MRMSQSNEVSHRKMLWNESYDANLTTDILDEKLLKNCINGCICLMPSESIQRMLIAGMEGIVFEMTLKVVE